MKFDIPKDWLEKKTPLEEGLSIEAGAAAPDASVSQGAREELRKRLQSIALELNDSSPECLTALDGLYIMKLEDELAEAIRERDALTVELKHTKDALHDKAMAMCGSLAFVRLYKETVAERDALRSQVAEREGRK